MNYKSQAIDFSNKMEYRTPPYSKRNWGHPWHSLCSYHGKIKPAIAHILVRDFTSPGDIVLDPLCGVGTIPFEACLQGRKGIGNDLSKLAYIVSSAKMNYPTLREAEKTITDLRAVIEDKLNENIDLSQADFGLNKKITDYFETNVLKEILILREYFLSLSTMTRSEIFVFACFLHILHGNRPYALSRTSHPLTPYAPKGEFVYKNVVDHIEKKVILSFNKEPDPNWERGETYNLDYRDLCKVAIPEETIDAIITSPPFSDSLRFYSQNWMRLWLAGWTPEDFKNVDQRFLETQQDTDLSIYIDFFDKCQRLLTGRGKLILHLGKTRNCDMARELEKLSKPFFRTILTANENVQGNEKHGIKDKGGTIEHQYLFLQKR